MKKQHLNLLYKNNALILAVVGFALITTALILGHVEIKHLFVTILAETGGLLLVVGILHWMFEYRMREEMLHEISHTVLSNERIRQNGIIDCLDNSHDLGRSLEHSEQWQKAEQLIIGAHYADAFFSDYFQIFEERCKAGRQTTVLISDPNGLGIKYLKDSDPEVPDVNEKIQRIIKLLTEPPYGCKTNMEIYLHSVVLRYLFIATEECLWIVPMLNSKGRSATPALQIRHNSTLYSIFHDDIQRLVKQSKSFTQ